MLAIDVEATLGTLELSVRLPPAGGTTLVIGPNGAGKTTLIKCLLGAVKLARGEIRLDQAVLYSHDQRIDVPMERRKLGYLPQRYALFPHMTVARNVAFGIRDCKGAERKERVSRLLDDLGVPHLAGRMPPTLSGGESQRVALARALAIRPRALLLDEPMAALDAGAREKVRAFLAERLRRLALPTIIISHDLDDVEALGDRVVVLERGQVVQIGTLDELRANPASPFVDQFLRATPDLDPGAG